MSKKKINWSEEWHTLGSILLAIGMYGMALLLKGDMPDWPASIATAAIGFALILWKGGRR
ncbi:hypothetical protein ACFY7C_19370 [Streptomyces sp. NPDC012769]|uniref:hypothetical protein n=1 Tax=Streptomyces sp. NPDC012769 TaxID=3364848 RepID=UPI00367B6B8B